MKKDYEIIIRDVFGGDGELRYIQVEEAKLSRKRTKIITKTDLGIPVESGVDEIIKEKKRLR